jgi:hypothetical protein
MKMNSMLKGFLKKYYLTIIFFILKNYFGLDFLNDFNPFTSETTKYFNGNNPQGSSIDPPSEGEGSNRQNNPQSSNINLPSFKEVAEQAGIESKEEFVKGVKELYEKNSEYFGQVETMLDQQTKDDVEAKKLIS